MILSKISSHALFDRVFIPVIAAVLIDGISEVFKGLGTFIAHQVSDDMLIRKVDWDGLLTVILGIGLMITLLYFVIKAFARYESHNLSERAAVLALALIVLGATNLWEVALQRPTMRDRYNDIQPGESLQDIEKKFLASWDQKVYFHTNETFGLCVNDCSFALIYKVPKVFGEESFKLEFDSTKKVLRKKWYD